MAKNPFEKLWVVTEEGKMEDVSPKDKQERLSELEYHREELINKLAKTRIELTKIEKELEALKSGKVK